jgi:hypothetical protein
MSAKKTLVIPQPEVPASEKEEHGVVQKNMGFGD